MNYLSRLQKLKNLIIISLFVVAFDQVTKIWAYKDLRGSAPIDYFGGLVKIIYAENTGAWGNLGADWGELGRFLFLILIPIFVLIGFGFYSIWGSGVKRFENYSLALVVSGGAGNLIDRVFHGFVVDFMWMGFRGSWMQTNIFNIADVAIMIGFGGLVIMGIIDYFEQKKNAPNPSNPSLPPQM